MLSNKSNTRKTHGSSCKKFLVVSNHGGFSNFGGRNTHPSLLEELLFLYYYDIREAKFLSLNFLATIGRSPTYRQNQRYIIFRTQSLGSQYTCISNTPSSKISTYLQIKCNILHRDTFELLISESGLQLSLILIFKVISLLVLQRKFYDEWSFQRKMNILIGCWSSSHWLRLDFLVNQDSGHE